MSVFNIITLLGGLAMFLYGMRLMGDSLKEGSSGTLKLAMEKLTGGTQEAGTFQVLGSSRTDAGVHALGQVASVWTDSTIPIEAFARALNANLPGDILVLDAEEAPEDFHPIRCTERKRYRYLIQDGPLPELFLRRYAWRMGKLTASDSRWQKKPNKRKRNA